MYLKIVSCILVFLIKKFFPKFHLLNLLNNHFILQLSTHLFHWQLSNFTWQFAIHSPILAIMDLYLTIHLTVDLPLLKYYSTDLTDCCSLGVILNSLWFIKYSWTKDLMLKQHLWHPSFSLQLFPKLETSSSFKHTSYFECFLWNSALKFFLRMLLSFSADLTKIILTTPTSTYSFRCLYRISMCLIHDVVVIFLTINIAPTLSTLNMTGSWTKFPCIPAAKSQT